MFVRFVSTQPGLGHTPAVVTDNPIREALAAEGAT